MTSSKEPAHSRGAINGPKWEDEAKSELPRTKARDELPRLGFEMVDPIGVKS